MVLLFDALRQLLYITLAHCGAIPELYEAEEITRQGNPKCPVRCSERTWGCNMWLVQRSYVLIRCVGGLQGN